MAALRQALPSISIHALLAESDNRKFFRKELLPYFYPRSPCGERLQAQQVLSLPAPFLSTLSLRRATAFGVRYRHIRFNFYPRSPCGERLLGNAVVV